MEELITPFGKNHFFGYYDKSPMSPSKKYLLSHEVESFGKKIDKIDKAKICFTQLDNKKINYIENTYSWNYQQGSQLQWISNEKFIFNNYDGNHIAKIYNINSSKIEKTLKNPIYSMSDNFKIFSSVDYSRIHKYREGYGYLNEEYRENESLLKICSLETSKTIINLKKKNFSEFAEIDVDNCWIDHILFSPGCYDFIFLLRFKNKNSDLLSYVFFYDFEKKELYNILSSGMAGHGCWVDSKNFIIWARKKMFTQKISKINNLFLKRFIKLIRYIGVPNLIRKKIYGDQYIEFNKEIKYTKELNLEIPMNLSGGHFSFLNKDLMISDTYHDNNFESNLFSYNMKDKVLKKIKNSNVLRK